MSRAVRVVLIGFFAGVVCLGEMGATLLQAEESVQSKIQQSKREIEKARREIEQQRAAMQSKQVGASTTGPVLPKKTPVIPKPATFEPSKAPAPQVCFNDYLNAVRQATSVDQILPYMQPAEAELLKERQRQYDPKQAAERQARYRQEGTLSEEQITHLTASPYENDLKFRKRVAEKIQRFLSAKVNGDQATLQVSIRIDEVINGVRYTKSTATVGMVGEGTRWYMTTFKESNVAER